jgi:D-sedoheptulose 7-phosphate isomerase
MKQYTKRLLQEFFLKWPRLSYLESAMEVAIEESVKRIGQGGKILLCGNGGSAADCEHIAGELLKEFYIKRPLSDDFKAKLKNNYGEEGVYLGEHLQGAIEAISLVSHTGLLSAYGNDAAPELSYAQQIVAYGGENDVLISISTSGNAENVIYASMMAKMKGTYVIGLTGEAGGNLKRYTDTLLNVPEHETYLVQELHLPMYHLYCRGIEYEVFGGES